MDDNGIDFNNIKNALSKEGIIEPTYKIVAQFKPGDGYMGLHKTIVVNGKNKSLELFVKIASTDVKFRNEAQVRKLYLNECLFYKTIYPSLIKFQEEKKSPKMFKSLAKCYGVVSAEMKEIIILENLEVDGYAVLNRRNFMSKDHIEMVLKEYGHFHAACYAIKDQNRELHDELSRDIYTPATHLIHVEAYQKLFHYLIDGAKESLDPIKDKGVCSIFNKFAEEVIPFLMYGEKLANDECAIITHGDGWCNNFMFKYSDPDNPTKPTSMRFLDFQMMRVGSPVFDLSYFFYTSCSKHEMDGLEYFLQLYYDSLASNIKLLGSNPDVLYPYTKLQEEWRKYSRYGLIFGLMVLKIMLTEPDEVVSVAEKDHSSKNFMFNIREDKIYKERVRDVIVHFANNGFLELLNII